MFKIAQLLKCFCPKEESTENQAQEVIEEVVKCNAKESEIISKQEVANFEESTFLSAELEKAPVGKPKKAVKKEKPAKKNNKLKLRKSVEIVMEPSKPIEKPIIVLSDPEKPIEKKPLKGILKKPRKFF